MARYGPGIPFVSTSALVVLFIAMGLGRRRRANPAQALLNVPIYAPAREIEKPWHDHQQGENQYDQTHSKLLCPFRRRRQNHA